MKTEIREDVEEIVAQEAECRHRGTERGGHAGGACVWSSRGSRVSLGQRRDRQGWSHGWTHYIYKKRRQIKWKQKQGCSMQQSSHQAGLTARPRGLQYFLALNSSSVFPSIR